MVAKKTHEQYVEGVKKNRPNIEILSEYKGNNKEIKYRCDRCKQIHTIKTAHSLYKTKGCPTCYTKHKKSYNTMYNQKGKFNIKGMYVILYKNERKEFKNMLELAKFISSFIDGDEQKVYKILARHFIPKEVREFIKFI